LQRGWVKINGILEKKHYLVKTFQKDESYPAYKHSRMINSRTDQFKCAVGPIFRQIEKEVFSLPHFIKKVPINDRPKYIINRIKRWDAIYLATDYTAYEAHFTREVMEAVEFVLYEYMVSKLPGGQAWLNLVKSVIGGRNVCVNKNMTIEINATRMSGEMNTSLGNGFSNLIFMLYAAEKCGCSEVIGVVEGDDGLFSMKVNEGGCIPSVEFFASIGLTLKLEVHANLETASFCGLVFDEHDLNNVTNPLEELAEFGWTSRRYLKSASKKLEQLLRSKAFSMAYQYPGCPILKSLAAYGLRVTRRHGKIGSEQFAGLMDKCVDNVYYREQMAEALKLGIPDVKIGDNTRRLVERLYGIPVDAQLEAEAYLDSLDVITPLRLNRLVALCPMAWVDYYGHYVMETTLSVVDRPSCTWPYKRSLDVFGPGGLAGRTS
jgi:hypothetical protein